MHEAKDPEEYAFWPLALTALWMPCVPIIAFYILDGVRAKGMLATTVLYASAFAVPYKCISAALILRKIKSRSIGYFIILNILGAVFSALGIVFLVLLGTIRWGI